MFSAQFYIPDGHERLLPSMKVKREENIFMVAPDRGARCCSRIQQITVN